MINTILKKSQVLNSIAFRHFLYPSFSTTSFKDINLKMAQAQTIDQLIEIYSSEKESFNAKQFVELSSNLNTLMKRTKKEPRQINMIIRQLLFTDFENLNFFDIKKLFSLLELIEKKDMFLYSKLKNKISNKIIEVLESQFQLNKDNLLVCYNFAVKASKKKIINLSLNKYMNQIMTDDASNLTIKNIGFFLESFIMQNSYLDLEKKIFQIKLEFLQKNYSFLKSPDIIKLYKLFGQIDFNVLERKKPNFILELQNNILQKMDEFGEVEIFSLLSIRYSQKPNRVISQIIKNIFSLIDENGKSSVHEELVFKLLNQMSNYRDIKRESFKNSDKIIKFITTFFQSTTEIPKLELFSLNNLVKNGFFNYNQLSTIDQSMVKANFNSKSLYYLYELSKMQIYRDELDFQARNSERTMKLAWAILIYKYHKKFPHNKKYEQEYAQILLQVSNWSEYVKNVAPQQTKVVKDFANIYGDTIIPNILADLDSSQKKTVPYFNLLYLIKSNDFRTVKKILLKNPEAFEFPIFLKIFLKKTIEKELEHNYSVIHMFLQHFQKEFQSHYPSIINFFISKHALSCKNPREIDSMLNLLIHFIKNESFSNIYRHLKIIVKSDNIGMKQSPTYRGLIKEISKIKDIEKSYVDVKQITYQFLKLGLKNIEFSKKFIQFHESHVQRKAKDWILFHYLQINQQLENELNNLTLTQQNLCIVLGSRVSQQYLKENEDKIKQLLQKMPLFNIEKCLFNFQGKSRTLFKFIVSKYFELIQKNKRNNNFKLCSILQIFHRWESCWSDFSPLITHILGRINQNQVSNYDKRVHFRLVKFMQLSNIVHEKYLQNVISQIKGQIMHGELKFHEFYKNLDTLLCISNIFAVNLMIKNKRRYFYIGTNKSITNKVLDLYFLNETYLPKLEEQLINLFKKINKYEVQINPTLNIYFKEQYPTLAEIQVKQCSENIEIYEKYVALFNHISKKIEMPLTVQKKGDLYLFELDEKCFGVIDRKITSFNLPRYISLFKTLFKEKDEKTFWIISTNLNSKKLVNYLSKNISAFQKSQQLTQNQIGNILDANKSESESSDKSQEESSQSDLSVDVEEENIKE